MTHHPDVFFARRWRSFALAAVLLVLSGAVVLVWLRIDAADTRASGLAAEANLRGDAVTTLATDVRTLRSQLQATGATPRAPDPATAVEDLPERAEVPVPIPGPPGPAGPRGEDGAAAPTVTPAPGRAGADGADGADGSDSTVPGPAGPPGPAGSDSTVPGPAGKDSTVPGPAGKDGRDGADGQTCPDGYTLQPPPTDPDALVCRRNSAPTNPPSTPPATLGLARREDL